MLTPNAFSVAVTEGCNFEVSTLQCIQQAYGPGAMT